MSVNESSQSSAVETGSSNINEGVVNWDSLVIEQDYDAPVGVDENEMIAMLGLTEECQRQHDPVPVPIPIFDLQDSEGTTIVVNDKAPEEPLIVWDKKNPKMDMDTPYPNMKEFRMALRQFAINGEFEYGTKRNQKERIHAFCKGESRKGEPCQWELYARCKKEENCIVVVMHQMSHICDSTSRVKKSMASQAWVADKATDIMKKEPTLGAGEIRRKLQDEHNIKLDYDTVWKGKQRAAKSLYGSWEESFRMLYNYKAEIELRSLGSIVEIDTNTVGDEVHFSKLFIAFKPCIDGFLNGCRPYISIDSTHLNGKWDGQLAVVTALDGHNWMFPVAYGFIESESGDNWAWFMNQVKKALGDPPLLAVCTDACKGLENAVKRVFPQAEQRECMRHLWLNFQKYFHGDVFGRLWPAARAYKLDVYEHHMELVRAESNKVSPYLRDYHNLLWMRCKFNPEIKCDYINNNLAESFNNWVRNIKDLPIVQLADKIREMIMELFRKRRMIGERLQGRILPAIIHQLNANTRGLGHLKPKPSDNWCGEVRDTNRDDVRHVVSTLTHECTCLQWQHTGKPCEHALAFIGTLRNRDMEDFVHEYYSVSKFRAAYDGVIEPLTDKHQWPQVDIGFVLRPPLPKEGKEKKGAERKRKGRFKSWFEGGSRKKYQNKCKRCQELGHREANCPQNGTKKRKSSAKNDPTPWFAPSVSNAVPCTPTKSNTTAPVTRSQSGLLGTPPPKSPTPCSPGPVTRSQSGAAVGTPPSKKSKKMTPKKKKRMTPTKKSTEL